MSIEGKHAYRFGYLKSEQWQNVRIEALAREKGKCQICAEESISNDAHHVWYPERIYETRAEQLVVLCRPCHDFIHMMLPECKTNDEEKGRAEWLKFSNAIMVWRAQKIFIFHNPELFNLGILIGDSGPKALRQQLAKVYEELKIAVLKLSRYEKEIGPPPPEPEVPATVNQIEKEIRKVLSAVNKWSKAYRESSTRGKIEVADSDFQI